MKIAQSSLPRQPKVNEYPEQYLAWALKNIGHVRITDALVLLSSLAKQGGKIDAADKRGLVEFLDKHDAQIDPDAKSLLRQAAGLDPHGRVRPYKVQLMEWYVGEYSKNGPMNAQYSQGLVTTATNIGGGAQVNDVLKDALKQHPEAFATDGRRVIMDYLASVAKKPRSGAA